MKFHLSTSGSDWRVPLRIVLRLGVLVSVVTALWIAFALQVGLAEPEPFLGTLDQAAASQPHLLVMGDSTLFWRGPDEADTPSLEDTIAASYPELKANAVSEAALSLDLMEGSWRILRARGAAPRVAIVVVNLRSFSPTWFNRPDSYTEKVLHQLTWDSPYVRALYRPLMAFGALNKKSLKTDDYYRELHRLVAEAPSYFHLNPGNVKDASATALGERETYYLCYGLPFTEDHPLLIAMTNLVRALRKDGVKVLLYVTPVDVERGEHACGPAMTAIIRKNRETLVRVVATNFPDDPGLRLQDRADSAPSGDFLDHHGAPNEHLTFSGRERLWKSLKPTLDTLLAKSSESDGNSHLVQGFEASFEHGHDGAGDLDASKDDLGAGGHGDGQEHAGETP